jgi:hypothetical protein
MNKYRFIRENEPNNKDEILKDIFKKTEKYLSDKAETFKKDVFSEVADDIETWIEERLDNVLQRNFTYLEQILFDGNSYVPNERKEAINNYLIGIGYTAEKFRKKLFDEHKDEILKALEGDIIYEKLKCIFDNYSFGNYSIQSLNTSYPQTSIIKGFARYMINQMPFNEFMESEINKTIKDAKVELNELRLKIKQAEEILDNE